MTYSVPTDEELLQFLHEHPEYFEGPVDALVLKKELRQRFEAYARALDPENYERLRERVEAYREKERARLREEIGELEAQRRREQKQLEQISWEMNKLEKELGRLEERIRALSGEESEGKSAPLVRSWYQSAYVFLFLDFLGVLFLYVGLILNEGLTLSYIVVGLLCVAGGFFLAYGGGRESVPDLSRKLETRERLTERKRQFSEISRIKRVTLAERKRAGLKAVGELNDKIHVNLQRINEFNH